MPKELFLDSTDFAVAIFKISQISKHFLAMLISGNKMNEPQNTILYLVYLHFLDNGWSCQGSQPWLNNEINLIQNMRANCLLPTNANL